MKLNKRLLSLVIVCLLSFCMMFSAFAENSIDAFTKTNSDIIENNSETPDETKSDAPYPYHRSVIFNGSAILTADGYEYECGGKPQNARKDDMLVITAENVSENAKIHFKAKVGADWEIVEVTEPTPLTDDKTTIALTREQAKILSLANVVLFGGEGATITEIICVYPNDPVDENGVWHPTGALDEPLPGMICDFLGFDTNYRGKGSPQIIDGGASPVVLIENNIPYAEIIEKINIERQSSHNIFSSYTDYDFIITELNSDGKARTGSIFSVEYYYPLAYPDCSSTVVVGYDVAGGEDGMGDGIVDILDVAVMRRMIISGEVKTLKKDNFPLFVAFNNSLEESEECDILDVVRTRAYIVGK